MRGVAGDKVIVKRDADQHDVYFSLRDERDDGSIIDFAMRRKGLNLGQVRKELRPWIGLPAALLASPRFSGRVRIDALGRAVFPHFDLRACAAMRSRTGTSRALPAAGPRGSGFAPGRNRQPPGAGRERDRRLEPRVLPRIPATAPSAAAHQARGRPSVGRSQLLKIFFRMSTILPTVIYKISIILRK